MSPTRKTIRFMFIVLYPNNLIKGDNANRILLDTYGKINQESNITNNRFVITHAQQISPDDLSKFSKYNIIATVQPLHMIDDSSVSKVSINVYFRNY
jgi:predicted amidohydrolase YtcJ